MILCQSSGTVEVGSKEEDQVYGSPWGSRPAPSRSWWKLKVDRRSWCDVKLARDECWWIHEALYKHVIKYKLCNLRSRKAFLFTKGTTTTTTATRERETNRTGERYRNQSKQKKKREPRGLMSENFAVGSWVHAGNNMHVDSLHVYLKSVYLNPRRRRRRRW